jgi:hypothetical protein
MSQALDLFLTLTANSCVVTADNEKLYIDDYESFLTDALRAQIRALKPQLIALVTATRIGQGAECPVSPTSQHQWYQLTHQWCPEMPVVSEATPDAGV